MNLADPDWFLGADVRFFEELLATCVVERTGAPTRRRSNLTNGYRRLPVRLGKEG